MSNPHIMLDLETLGKEPGCVVTSIAAAAFWPNNGNIYSEFKVNISIASSLKHGLKIDGKTLRWWLTQSPEAIRAMIEDDRELVGAICAFVHWFNSLGPIDGVWGHGATFDVPVLTAVFSAIGSEVPWHYRTPRDTRTLFSLAGFDPKAWPSPAGYIEHDAIWDCRAQVEWVFEAMKLIRVVDQ